MKEEVLKALVDKTVENASAIRELNEHLRKQAQPNPAAAELNQHLGELKEQVEVAGKSVTERIGELEGRIGKIGEGISSLSVQLGNPANWLLSGMHSLQKSLEEYKDFFSKPLKKEVHYKHMLGWPLWVLLGLLVIVGLEGWGLTNARSQADLHEQNDILWRAARLSEDSVVVHRLDKTMRDYQANPDQFRKDVEAEEERLTELAEQLRQEQENMGRIRELQRSKKR